MNEITGEIIARLVMARQAGPVGVEPMKPGNMPLFKAPCNILAGDLIDTHKDPATGDICPIRIIRDGIVIWEAPR